MKNIPRYARSDDEDAAGVWCRWADVEALQDELNDVRTKALAAVWDKQTIAKLQDELAYAREAYLRDVRPPTPGVSSVTGFRNGNRHVGYSLPITSVRDAPNGGLEIEVQLP